VYCGGGLAEENYQRGVIYALRIREATFFSLEKEVYFVPNRGGGVDINKCES